jgi:hypothetical protein
VLAFLLMLFPNWGNVRYAYLTRTNTPAIVAPKIIDAVKSKNIDALEAMMCKNIKQNTADLRGEIDKLLNAIDGEIITLNRGSNGGGYYESRNDGKTISQQILTFNITTATEAYVLVVTWETANNFAKDEVGIRNIGLVRLNPTTSLVIIRATNGIEDWHD